MYYTSIYSTKHVNWVYAKIHYFAGRHLEYLVTAGDTKNPPARLLLSDRSITRNNSQKPGAFQCIRHLWTEPGLHRLCTGGKGGQPVHWYLTLVRSRLRTRVSVFSITDAHHTRDVEFLYWINSLCFQTVLMYLISQTWSNRYRSRVVQ